MKLRIASDLHLEFFAAPVGTLAEHFLPPDDRDAGSVLVLAGDISATPLQLVEFLKCVEGRFLHVVYVPGNHEYYRHDFCEWNTEARRALAHMTLRRLTAPINRVGVADVGGVRFIACTLWADGGHTKQERKAVEGYMMDFKVIKVGSRKFLPSDMQTANRLQQEGIAEALGRSDGPVVVVTHHLPSYQLCHPRFGSDANGGFASDCDWLMQGELAPALWIHGHTHDSIDRTIGKTRVVCNPAGYQPEWGTKFNEFFAAPKFVEVPC